MRSEAFTCPAPGCGHVTREPDYVTQRYCPQCREYTGRCGAGRRVSHPGFRSGGGWHVPCTRTDGLVPWMIAPGGIWILLCSLHDSAMSAGETPARGTRLR